MDFLYCLFKNLSTLASSSKNFRQDGGAQDKIIQS
jgi:hypothetical protein